MFLSRKSSQNAEFAIAGAILDAGENWSGASDQFSRTTKMAPAIANSAFSGVFPR